MNQMAPGSNSELDRIFATISKVAGSDGSWLIIANKVAYVRDKELWRGRFKSQSEWLDAAADAAKVTTNTLRRMLAAAKFFNEQAEARKKSGKTEQAVDPASGSGKFVMATLEMIKRMHDVSPQHASNAFEKHLLGLLSYRAAKRQYDDLFSSFDPFSENPARATTIVGNPPWASFDAAKLSSRRAHRERSALGALIESHIESLSGIEVEKAEIGKIRFDYVAPDAVVVGNKKTGSAFVDAYDFKRLGLSTPKATVTKLISDAAFSATFFRRYWLILETSQEVAQDVVSSVDDLDLANIGVARYAADGQDNLDLLRAPTGAPTPDRHERSLKQATS